MFVYGLHPRKSARPKGGPAARAHFLDGPGARLFAANVAYCNEFGQQLPPFIDKVKIFLMIAHGTDQYFWGICRNAGSKLPRGVGFFHQAGHYLQQSRIDYRHSAGSLSQALNLSLDRRPALGKISDDMA
ncbi:MAG: hypothetical protein Ct9H300mP14_09320 [Gammaproteobacteria bacterium]|nr:MAG: hypothetical protein Ct9H300mP14_09320 [Gammaproteobacteria bacterium]